MANNLRVFNTNSEYQSADLVHPAVSYVIETDKVIYDYTPPTPPVFQGKWKATYSDSHTESAQCGSSSEIRQFEINTSNLVSVEIGDYCVTSIGNRAFNWCLSLTSVTIGDGVTSIGEGAFETCKSLTSVTIPSGVTIIYNCAFFQCTRLTSITVNAVTPPSLIGNLVFETTNNCPIYVPSGSVNAYKSAWSQYASRIQPIP